VAPETRYTKTADGVYLAYQVVGDGVLDIALMPGLIFGNVEVVWEHPLVDSFLRRLASIGRLILHDRRATGLSDRATNLPDLETRAGDLLAVLDAAGSKRTVLLGGTEAGAPAALVAATRPDRVSALIWWLAASRSRWAPDYPSGVVKEEEGSWLREIERGWGSESFASAEIAHDAPSLRGNRSLTQWLARMQRHLVTPGSAAQLARIWHETDVRHVLPAIAVPTLLLDREGQVKEADGFTASRISGAEHVVLRGDDGMPWAGDSDAVISAISRFLGVDRTEREHDRMLSTVLFTDIVGSTEKASGLGDAAWKHLLEEHHSVVRGHLSRYRGQEVDTAGDGFFATFDGPARAVRCAQQIVRAVQPMGLQVRTGVHTGEVQEIAGKIGGMGVVIGARVGSMAEPGEVLVSSTVKDLVAGSGLRFEDRGTHSLKGIPGEWHLYSAIGDPD
jgi:class 3 adenylate cyclase/pimeloyl-ACP methyl ester carboxylesterase